MTNEIMLTHFFGILAGCTGLVGLVKSSIKNERDGRGFGDFLLSFLLVTCAYLCLTKS